MTAVEVSGDRKRSKIRTFKYVPLAFLLAPPVLFAVAFWFGAR
jgi:hypothetical protein